MIQTGNNWEIPLKPAELTERRIISAILDNYFPVDSILPPERELCTQLGVTRPTLREALQRLSRDGWIEIRHGKPTRVRNYWQEGSLGVLGAISQTSNQVDPDLFRHLLSIRLLLAPTYTAQAVSNDPGAVQRELEPLSHLPAIPSAYAAADFDLHRRLTIASGNPIFTLILNGFMSLYVDMACQYFRLETARERSQEFYRDLLSAVKNQDPGRACNLTREMMEASISIWEQA